MARAKKVPAKITILGGFSPIQPIPRDRDNTDDLQMAEDLVHARMGHLRFPDKGGSFAPTGGTDAYNGKTVTAPPYKSS